MPLRVDKKTLQVYSHNLPSFDAAGCAARYRLDGWMALPPLYKYLDVQGAKLTLGNGTFKHAKPSDFNDIEDLTIQSIFPEEVEVALTTLSSGFNDVILQHLNDPPTCSSPMREMIALIQHAYRTNPKGAEIVKTELSKESVEPVYDVEYMGERSKPAFPK